MKPSKGSICASAVPKGLPSNQNSHLSIHPSQEHRQPLAPASANVTVKCYRFAGKALLRRQKNDPLNLAAGQEFPLLQAKGICAGKHA